MSEQEIVHATLITIDGNGVLIKGESRSGKSDLALRMILSYGAKLVADDAVRISKINDTIVGAAPENIAGLLEVYGVGIVKMEYVNETPLSLVVNLVNNPTQIERMPKKLFENIFGVEIMQIDLYAKENSAPEKVLMKLKGCLLNVDE